MSNAHKTILSICDHSGTWSAPYREAGYRVVTVDLKDVPPYPERIHKVCDARILPYFTGQRIYGLLFAPVCTDLSGSGAQYWKEKDADGRTLQALSLVDACLRQVAIHRRTIKFWCLENPVGRLKHFIGDCDDQFDPCDFAGYALWNSTTDDHRLIQDVRRRSEAGEKLTKADVELIMRWNLYTKRTQLWGNFVPPIRNRVEPIRASKQGSPLQLLGGKSERTKELRSITPSGFAAAFFRANP